MGKNEDRPELGGDSGDQVLAMLDLRCLLAPRWRYQIGYRGLELRGEVGGHLGNDQCRMMVFRAMGPDELIYIMSEEREEV